MKVDRIVTAPHCFTLEGKGVGYRSRTALVVDRGRIVDLAGADTVADRYQAEETLVLDHHVLLPGLVNAHIHSGGAILRGLAQDVANWMMQGVVPFRGAAGPRERLLGTRLSLAEAVRAGTTTFGDLDNDMDPVCDLMATIGVRGQIGQTIRDAERRQYQPDELYAFNLDQGRREMDRALELFDRWHGKADGRIRILFGPQAADFVGVDLLREVQACAKARGTRVHMHVQQGDRETRQTLARYGLRPIEFLRGIGYLDETLIAVHLTDADDREAEEVARSGASMVVCPGSIGLIDGLVPPSVAFQAAGGPCGLGSDQAVGNNSLNLFNEMKLVCVLNKVKYQDPEIMPAWRALRMATIEGARALGLGAEIGSLEVGKRADFIAVDLSQPSMLPVFTHPFRNLVPNLVYSARGSEVSLVVVDGRTILRDGQVLGLDEDQMRADLAEAAEAISAQAEEPFWQAGGPNAEYMRDGCF